LRDSSTDSSGDRSLHEASPDAAPIPDVASADDDDRERQSEVGGRRSEVAQLAHQADSVGPGVLDLRRDDQDVELAAIPGAGRPPVPRLGQTITR
jgi:hypothetical protein